jgi:hypothetical protein
MKNKSNQTVLAVAQNAITEQERIRFWDNYNKELVMLRFKMNGLCAPCRKPTLWGID